MVRPVKETPMSENTPSSPAPASPKGEPVSLLPLEVQRPAAPPPAPPPGGPPSWWHVPPAWVAGLPHRKPVVRWVLTGLLILAFLGSLACNLFLLVVLALKFESGFDKTVVQSGDKGQTIAVYNVTGLLDRRAADAFSRFCAEVLKDHDVKAVVLRVSSPGGLVSSSDQIRNSVLKMKQSGKKVVVSMGGVAASGGYYISAAADAIVAEPTTITGSIGVIAEWVVLDGTLEKIGAKAVVIKSSNADVWKDEMSIFKMPDERQKSHIRSVLDQMQARFEAVVREGRGTRLAPRTVPLAPSTQPGSTGRTEETEPFNGKIYLAEDARGLGMIDQIGYHEQAVDLAKSLAMLTRPNIVHYKPWLSLLGTLMGEVSAGSRGSFTLDRETLDELQTPRLMMLWKPQ
jgi:protease-4